MEVMPHHHSLAKVSSMVDGETKSSGGTTESVGSVDHLYNIMQSVENKLGGGEGVQGIYGSITQMGMSKVLEVLRLSCGMNEKSTLVDIGAGLGRPLLHAMLALGCRDNFGIEIDSVKVTKANAFVRQTLEEVQNRCPVGRIAAPPRIRCCAVEQVGTLDPATHAYSFWEGVPYEGREAFGRLFTKSRTCKAVVVVQRSVRREDPVEMMREYGFERLELVTHFQVKMSGSGRSFQAYVFNKRSIQTGPAPVTGPVIDEVDVEQVDQRLSAGLSVNDKEPSNQQVEEDAPVDNLTKRFSAVTPGGSVKGEESPTKKVKLVGGQEESPHVVGNRPKQRGSPGPYNLRHRQLDFARLAGRSLRDQATTTTTNTTTTSRRSARVGDASLTGPSTPVRSHTAAAPEGAALRALIRRGDPGTPVTPAGGWKKQPDEVVGALNRGITRLEFAEALVPSQEDEVPPPVVLRQESHVEDEGCAGATHVLCGRNQHRGGPGRRQRKGSAGKDHCPASGPDNSPSKLQCKLPAAAQIKRGRVSSRPAGSSIHTGVGTSPSRASRARSRGRGK